MWKYSLFIFCALFAQATFGQRGGPMFVPVSNDVTAPTTPAAYQYQKYGDVPIDTKTGIPSIGAPLYSIPCRDINWPISLKYNARGFKPSEIATEVGLGWTLETIGIISTQSSGPNDLVMPYDDDSTVVRRILDLSPSGGGSSCSYSNSGDQLIASENVISNTHNYLPDIYFLSMPGESVKFFIYKDTGYTIPASDTKIYLTRQYDGGDFDKALITVVDDKGTKYFFSTRGYSKNNSICQVGNRTLSLEKNYIFKLDSMRNIKNDFLQFYYHDATYSYAGQGSLNENEIPDVQDYPCNNFSPSQYAHDCSTSFDVQEEMLDSILASSGFVVKFKYNSRTDISGAEKLDTIICSNGTSSKTFVFYNSYFGTSIDQNLRLKLDSIKTYSQSTGIFDETYSFNYYTTNVLPVTTTLSVDSAGYYTGSDNDIENSPRLFDRGADLSIAQACVLNQINYPTGGFTKFYYELSPEFGGLRVNKTEDNPVQGPSIFKRYEYVVNHPPIKGIFSLPITTTFIYLVPGSTEIAADCSYTRYSSQSAGRTPYYSENFFYDTVREYFGQSGELGKIVYAYSRPKNYSYNALVLDAVMTEKDTYKNTGTGWQKLKAEINSYATELDSNLTSQFAVPVNPKEKRVWGTIIQQVRGEMFLHTVFGGVIQCLPKLYNQQHFSICTFPVELTEKKARDYFYNGATVDSVEQKEDFLYQSDNHNKATFYSYSKSNQDTNQQYFIFPQDYAAGTVFIDSLVKKNYSASPIEATTFINKNSSLFLSSGKINMFNNQSLFDTSFTYDTRSLIPLSSFRFSNKTSAGQLPYQSSGQSFSKDGAYTVDNVVDSYNNSNIAEAHNRKDMHNSFLWGYNSSYLIAQVKDATITDIAATSFEADVNGNWSIGSSSRDTTGAVTGKMSYQLSNGNVVKSSLNSSHLYTLTYWTKNSSAFSITGNQGTPVLAFSVGGWHCFVHSITGISTLTLSGTGLIDELRLYPTGSQMVTFTYDPLIGMTSQCDINNRIIYYEYDNLNRLKLIRDQDHNILKTYDYKYQANSNQ